MIAFGLDLSGYSTGRSSFVAIESLGERARAFSLKGTALTGVRHGCDDAEKTLSAEVAVLKTCLELGHIAVDIPIDLQGLPAPPDATFIWELTKRAVDEAFQALPPLADRLGAPVARFKAILRRGQLEDHVGTSILETYPAGSLDLWGLRRQGYKGKGKQAECAELARCLRLTSDQLDEDELDAVICALTAIEGNGLFGEALEDIVRNRNPFTEFSKRGSALPLGYTLAKRMPFDQIDFVEIDYTAWLIGLKK